MSDSDDSDSPDYALLFTDKNGDKIRMKTFPGKMKCNKKYKKKATTGHSVVMIRGGKVVDKKVTGGERKVAFLIGAGFGRGWCDLGPLDNEGSRYQCFRDDSDDEADGAGSDGDDDDADDNNFHLIKVTRDGSGIRDEEFTKKKKVEKKFESFERKGRMAIIVRNDNIKDFTNPRGDEWKERQLSALIGMAFGKGMCTDLGPLEDAGPMNIFDSDAGSDSD